MRSSTGESMLRVLIKHCKVKLIGFFSKLIFASSSGINFNFLTLAKSPGPSQFPDDIECYPRQKDKHRLAVNVQSVFKID